MLRRTVFMVLASTLMIGCASTIYDKAGNSWDAWIGTSKDDRVKDLGIPIRCHTFKSGGETCEWLIRWNADITGTMNIQFDPRGNACQWTYRDPYEERRSQNKCS